MAHSIHRRSFARVALSAALLLEISSCGRDKPASQAAPAGATVARGLDMSVEPPRQAGGSGFAHVTYQPTVRIVEQKAGANALIGESRNGHGLVFDETSPEINALKAGDVLVIKGLIARKILAVERTGGEVVVVTDPASMTDVVKEGEVHVEAPIRFGTLPTADRRTPSHSWTDWLIAPAYADAANIAGARASDHAASGASRDAMGNIASAAGGAVFGDWKVSKWSATPVGDRLEVDLEMAKDKDGFKGLVDAHGFINNFNMIHNFKVNAQAGETSLLVQNVSVDITFKWTIAKETPGPWTNEDKIKLPAPLKIPLSQYVGGLPLFLEISAALLIHPALTGGSEIANGSYKLTYSGSMGISGTNGDTTGTSDGEGAVEIVDDGGMSAVAPVGMILGIGAPRFELQLGLSEVFPKLGKVSEAIDKIDAKIDKLAKAHMSPEWYAAATKAVDTLKDAIKSQADVFAQLIVTEGVTRTGSSAVHECSWIKTVLTAQVGMNYSFMGIHKDAKDTTKDVWTKEWIRVDPPGTTLCENIGK